MGSRRFRWAVILALGAVAGAPRARAEPTQSSLPRVEAPRQVYPHHGFYLRFASGFAAYDERLSSGRSAEGERSGRNRGIATLGELAIGGSPGPRWVIGGGIYSADLIASTYRSKTASPPAELDPGLRNVALIAPFLDYALESVPGLHVQAALGLATLTPRVLGDAATSRSKYLAVGAGLMFGGGYEWDIAENWRLGVLSRTTFSVLRGHDDTQVSWTHVIVTSPGLLLTITYQ